MVERPESALKLRALGLPYTNAPRTWAMGIGQEGFIPQRPAPPITETLNAGAVAAPVGFWNNIPLEEQREPVPVLPPSYGRKKLDMAAVNVKEMAILLGLTYLFLVLSHLVILIMRFTH